MSPAPATARSPSISRYRCVLMLHAGDGRHEDREREQRNEQQLNWETEDVEVDEELDRNREPNGAAEDLTHRSLAFRQLQSTEHQTNTGADTPQDGFRQQVVGPDAEMSSRHHSHDDVADRGQERHENGGL